MGVSNPNIGGLKPPKMDGLVNQQIGGDFKTPKMHGL